MDPIRTYPAVAAVWDAAHNADVRSAETGASLRAFIAACLSYMPGWMRLLYRVRAVFVRILGQRQEEMPDGILLREADVSYTPGAQATIFTVLAGEEERYWIAYAEDEIIAGHLAFVAEPLPGGRRRVHLVSTATYRSWRGRVYYNVIRPFHHIVVWSMLRHAARA